MSSQFQSRSLKTSSSAAVNNFIDITSSCLTPRSSLMAFLCKNISNCSRFGTVGKIEIRPKFRSSRYYPSFLKAPPYLWIEPYFRSLPTQYDSIKYLLKVFIFPPVFKSSDVISSSLCILQSWNCLSAILICYKLASGISSVLFGHMSLQHNFYCAIQDC